MSEGIRVDGADQLVRSMRDLAGDLGNLTPAHQRAGDLLLTRAGTKVPRQSGRLAASGRVDAASDETSVVYDEVYAGVIHNGWPAHNISPQPWLSDAAEESQTAVVGVFVDFIEDAVNRVHT